MKILLIINLACTLKEITFGPAHDDTTLLCGERYNVSIAGIQLYFGLKPCLWVTALIKRDTCYTISCREWVLKCHCGQFTPNTQNQRSEDSGMSASGSWTNETTPTQNLPYSIDCSCLLAAVTGSPVKPQYEINSQLVNFTTFLLPVFVLLVNYTHSFIS